jgi:hypothetical protein
MLRSALLAVTTLASGLIAPMGSCAPSSRQEGRVGPAQCLLASLHSALAMPKMVDHGDGALPGPR